MKLNTVDGNELGKFIEIREESKVKTNVSLVDADVSLLKAEISRREKVVPFVELSDKIIEEIDRNVGHIDIAEQLVYEREFDVLGRPNVWIGVNLSDHTLEQIVEKDKQIRAGLLPRRKFGESRMVWTDRLVVNEKTGVAVPYVTLGTIEDQEHCVVDFVLRVKAKQF